jgi:hypothetical protein
VVDFPSAVAAVAPDAVGSQHRHSLQALSKPSPSAQGPWSRTLQAMAVRGSSCSWGDARSLAHRQQPPPPPPPIHLRCVSAGQSLTACCPLPTRFFHPPLAPPSPRVPARRFPYSLAFSSTLCAHFTSDSKLINSSLLMTLVVLTTCHCTNEDTNTFPSLSGQPGGASNACFPRLSPPSISPPGPSSAVMTSAIPTSPHCAHLPMCAFDRGLRVSHAAPLERAIRTSTARIVAAIVKMKASP